MGEFSITHLLIVGIVLLVFFGPSRLPGLGQSLGKAIRGFKEGLSDDGPERRSSDQGLQESLPSRATQQARLEPSDQPTERGASHPAREAVPAASERRNPTGGTDDHS
jgi:sec-independent protein translocase protein TatA